MSQRDDGTLSRADFTFDQERNVYVCPAGKLLTTTGTVHDGRTILYRTSLRNCSSCPIKPKCCPNTPQRKIPRDLNENARDHARALMGTPSSTNRAMSARRSRCALRTSRPTIASSVCACGVSLVRETNAISSPPCRTSRPSRNIVGGRRRTYRPWLSPDLISGSRHRS